MKLKQEFVLRNVAGDNILIPVTGIDNKFDGLITLNETGVFIWKQLEAGKNQDEIVKALLDEYDVSDEQANRDVTDILNQLIVLGILE